MNVLKVELQSHKAGSSLSSTTLHALPLSRRFSQLLSLTSISKHSVYQKSTVWSYCTSTGDKKNEEKVDIDKKDEHTDDGAKSSPFARKASSRDHSHEEAFKFVPPQEPNPNSRVPPGKLFSPTYIITINTEKGVLRRLWRGMGLVSFNFMIAARSWKTKPNGMAIPEFWEKQLRTARLDALLLMWAICAITGADIMLFLAWILGAVYFPENLIPGVFRTPSRAEVRAFVYDHLKDLDEDDTGYVSIKDAKRVLMVVEREMTEETLDAVLNAAGADGERVDYDRLSNVIIGHDSQ